MVYNEEFTETRDLWSKEMYVDIRKLYNENVNDKIKSDSTKELIDKLGYYLQNIGYNY